MPRHISPEFPKGIRIEGLVIKDGKILLMHRIKHGEEYYVLPGGGWEDDETAETGVAREVLEETSVVVTVEKKVFELTEPGHGQEQTYLCTYVSGTPKLGESNEKERMATDSEDFYDPQWFPIEKIPTFRMFSEELQVWLVDTYITDKKPDGAKSQGLV